MDRNSALRHAVDLLLSPQEEPFQRYLDICDDVHACDDSGNTLLHWAAALGNFAAAYALLQRGVDVDACNAYGATPLCVAAAICPNVSTLGFLLVSHGASLEPRVKGADNDMSVQFLLEARELGHVWRWLVDAQQTGSVDSELHVNSFQGCRELPTKSDEVASLLCPPRELERLRKAVSQASVNGGWGSGGPSSSSSAAAAVVSVPHPPPRDHPAISRMAASGERTHTSCPASSRQPRGDDVAAITHALLLQVELLLSQESAARLAVEKDQAESFLELYAATTVLLDDWYGEEREESMAGEDEDETTGWGVLHGGLLEDRNGAGSSSSSSRGGALGLVGSIESVLGERIDADGRHHLLVQYRDPTAEEGHSEAWQLADAVMADPVVHAHLARSYSGNVSVDTSDVKTPSIMTLANAGSPLDTWEREQLEAQLRLLPRRFLQSHEGGSPLHPQSLSTVLASRSGTFTAAKHGASPVMSNFVFSEQFRPRSSDSNTVANRHTTSAAAYEMPSHRSDQQQHEQRASWRFAAGHPHQFSALLNDAEPSEEIKPTTRQLLLSDRWSAQNHLAEVLLDDAGSSIHTAVPARQTPTPPSMKNTFGGASDVSDDTLASLTPAPCSAATKAPTTYRSSTANAHSSPETNTRLTASQKMDYNAFLYGSALRLLDQKRHRRRNSAGREHSS